MVKPAKRAVRLGIAALLALVIGSGAAYAVDRPEPGVTADRVTILKSEGVTCGSCADRIEKALQAKEGVASVEVDVNNGGVAVAYNSKVIKPEILVEIITALGYKSSIAKNFLAEEYRALTGKDVASQAPAKAGGCGCCNKNRN